MSGIMLYFSGTGNSRYIALRFAQIMKREYREAFEVHSIEEECDFQSMMHNNAVIGFCYPIYGSSLPKIMRRFVTRYRESLKDKKLILFCTQLVFSGDGARAFSELLKDVSYEVVLAEHFNMPNSICNIPFFNIRNGDELRGILIKAERRLDRACKALHENKRRLRGFNAFSHLLGLSQRPMFQKAEESASDQVAVDETVCSRCAKCVRECPAKNLYIENGRIKARGDCTLCYRCVNHCPNQAITVWIHNKVKEQYRGIPEKNLTEHQQTR